MAEAGSSYLNTPTRTEEQARADACLESISKVRRMLESYARNLDYQPTGTKAGKPDGYVCAKVPEWAMRQMIGELAAQETWIEMGINAALREGGGNG